MASTAAHMHSTSVRVHRTPAMTAPSPVAAAAANDAMAALTAPFFWNGKGTWNFALPASQVGLAVGLSAPGGA